MELILAGVLFVCGLYNMANDKPVLGAVCLIVCGLDIAKGMGVL